MDIKRKQNELVENGEECAVECVPGPKIVVSKEEFENIQKPSGLSQEKREENNELLEKIKRHVIDKSDKGMTR